MEDRKKYNMGLFFERHAPFVLTIISVSFLIYNSNFFASKFSSGAWNNVGLYSAIFGWSAIQTGFAFGVYGFIIGKGDGFIQAVKNTTAMSRFMRYIKTANISGFLLTISSIPLIVVEPKIDQPCSLSYLLVASWFGLFVWSFLSFLRLAYSFGPLASTKDKVVHGA